MVRHVLHAGLSADSAEALIKVSHNLELQVQADACKGARACSSDKPDPFAMMEQQGAASAMQQQQHHFNPLSSLQKECAP